MFLYSWVCVLQSRHTSVCQFLKDMILKWNYSANKSFLLLLKFIWVISGKGKARRVHSAVSLINILGRGTIYQQWIVPQSPSLNYGGGGGQRKKGEYNCTKLHGFRICAPSALEKKIQHRKEEEASPQEIHFSSCLRPPSLPPCDWPAWGPAVQLWCSTQIEFFPHFSYHLTSKCEVEIQGKYLSALRIIWLITFHHSG